MTSAKFPDVLACTLYLIRRPGSFTLMSEQKHGTGGTTVHVLDSSNACPFRNLDIRQTPKLG